MLKAEWKSILHSKMTMVIIIGIALIPALYTTFFLGSMWDPYGKADRLPVAIVNEDQKVDYEGKEFAVGDELVEKLREEKPLDASFVESKNAMEGLKNGTYYMVVTIPENFSKNATTLLDQEPQKMELLYQTNPGRNFFAAKITDSAVKTMKESIGQQVTEVYAETIFDQIKGVGDQLTQAADGANTIASGEDTALEGSQTLKDNLKKMAESSLTFQEGADTLSQGVETYTDGVHTLASGSQQLYSGVEQLESKVPTLADGVSSLDKGASSLFDGISTYTDGTAKIGEGSQTLKENSSKLSQGISELDTSLSENLTNIAQGSQGLTQGLETMNNQIPTAEDLTTLQAGVGQISDSIQALNAALEGQELSVNQENIVADLTTIQLNLQLLSQGLSNLDTENTVSVNGQDVEDIKSACYQSILNAPSFQQLSEEEKNAILSEVSGQFQQISGNTSSNQTSATDLAQLSGYVSNVASATSNLSTELNGLGGAAQSFSSLKENVKALADQSKEPLALAQSSIGGLGAVKNGLNDPKGIINGATTLQQGLVALQEGTSAGTSQLVKGTNDFEKGVGDLNTALTTLNQNSATLRNGSKQLSNGTNALNQNIPTLTSGVTQLSNGMMTLKDGAVKLDANSTTLRDGVSLLSDGAGAIADGSGQLSDGAGTLMDGMTQLSDGAKELGSKLSDGADQVKEVSANDQTYKMMAEPAVIDSQEITHVQNNGIAMAPYMFSVSLYVGGIALCVMYPIASRNKKGKSGIAWWLSKASVLAISSVLQSAIMLVVLMSINGLEPMQAVKTFFLSILVSFTFMTIISTLNLWFGAVGKFLSMILLILQLAGSAGTYPIELSGGIFEKMHPFLPATYSIDAFHQTLSIGGSIFSDVVFLSTVMVIFSILGILYFEYQIRKEKKVPREEMDQKPAMV